jgi:hypothetical protein
MLKEVRIMSLFGSLIRLACLAALAALLSLGQSYTASIRGTVTDATGAAVPGAKVVATEAERNIPRTTVTDEAGR